MLIMIVIFLIDKYQQDLSILLSAEKRRLKTGVSWKKPFIGFEPMTYALPWRYSTTELKGLKKKNKLAIFHHEYTECIYVHILHT